MRINTKLSVALHCLIFIAVKQEQIKITSDILSETTGCNAVLIRRLLNSMQKAGIITTARGVGGTHLIKAPSDLTLYDVYEAIEPEEARHFIGIHPKPSEHCSVGKNIKNVLSSAYDEIEAAAFDAMKKITLQQLIDRYNFE